MSHAKITTHPIDEKKVEIFSERMLQIINDGALTLLISLAHRTGLFDTMAKLEPATSEEIANQASLNERYVRECLGGLVTGKLINYNPKNKTYHLPPEHAAILTRDSKIGNFAVTTQFIPVLAEVENQIVECFKKGGGVPYEAYNRFHEVMAEESNQTVVAALKDSILPLAPGVKEELEKGIKVLDVGCGVGRALNELAQTFPKSQFIGYDLCEDTIRRAKKEAQEKNLTNINFEVKDDAQMDFENHFELITAFDSIHDQAKPEIVLMNINRALKPNGTFLMQDIAGSSHLENNLDHPIGPFSYGISCMHCMTVSLSQDGAGLGAMWGKEKAVEMLNAAGFSHVNVEQLPHDFINYYYISKKA